MDLTVDILGIESGGKPFVFLNEKDAQELGVSASGRIQINSNRDFIAIVNIAYDSVKKGHIGIVEEVRRKLAVQNGDVLEVHIAPFPESLQFVRNKLNGKRLQYSEIYEIVKAVVDGNLNENEIAAFITALHTQGLSLDEATSLSSSMVSTGKQLQFDSKVIVDKHSIGGVPGDKTTLIVVPIVASAGLIIPKTSSRAITSAAGTADRAESLMRVDLNAEDMKKVVKKANGCIAWGGALDLAPADDIFVRTEYSLCIDPLLLPSIMSKKKAVGATHLVVDIPTGRGAKVKTIGEADLLAKDIIELGNKLGIHTHCILTFGEQPIGNAVGPALEAKEALEILMNRPNVKDVLDKACHIAGSIFDMTNIQNGYEKAMDLVRSGKAEEKLRQIIELQGGNPKIKPEDIPIGSNFYEVRAETEGNVLWIDNNLTVDIARSAGSPKHKGSGVLFNKKTGDRVKKNDLLFTVYSEKPHKISRVEEMLKERLPIKVGDKIEMFIHHVKESPVVKREFVLDR